MPVVLPEPKVPPELALALDKQFRSAWRRVFRKLALAAGDGTDEDVIEAALRSRQILATYRRKPGKRYAQLLLALKPSPAALSADRIRRAVLELTAPTKRKGPLDHEEP